MTDYQPKPGDEVLLTVRAKVDEQVSYRVPSGGIVSELSTASVLWDNPSIVRVEPAPVELPTGFGARIRATVDSTKWCDGSKSGACPDGCPMCCDRCNYDLHICPGCGAPLAHGVGCCEECASL